MQNLPGPIPTLEFDDDKKTIYGVAKITDDAAWENCKEGVYNIFQNIAAKFRSR